MAADVDLSGNVRQVLSSRSPAASLSMVVGDMGVKVVRVNAADRYLKALEGVGDPEAKRKVIGNPFPGPGLGVRILGEVKREYAELLGKADAIFIEELRAADLYD